MLNEHYLINFRFNKTFLLMNKIFYGTWLVWNLKIMQLCETCLVRCRSFGLSKQAGQFSAMTGKCWLSAKSRSWKHNTRKFKGIQENLKFSMGFTLLADQLWQLYVMFCSLSGVTLMTALYAFSFRLHSLVYGGIRTHGLLAVL